MKVKNLLRPAARPTCGCNSWIEHWENATGLTRPKQCTVVRCTRPLDGGAHVVNCSKVSKNTRKIAPLCTVHNSPHNRDCHQLQVGTKTPSASKLNSCK